MLLVLELQEYYLAAAGYGGDKAIFGYGDTGSGEVSINLT
jgi:hypothetical protein